MFGLHLGMQQLDSCLCLLLSVGGDVVESELPAGRRVLC